MRGEAIQFRLFDAERTTMVTSAVFGYRDVERCPDMAKTAVRLMTELAHQRHIARKSERWYDKGVSKETEMGAIVVLVGEEDPEKAADLVLIEGISDGWKVGCFLLDEIHAFMDRREFREANEAAEKAIASAERGLDDYLRSME